MPLNHVLLFHLFMVNYAQGEYDIAEEYLRKAYDIK